MSLPETRRALHDAPGDTLDRANSDVVLIVDDVPDNLSVLHDALDESGYTVLVATSGDSESWMPLPNGGSTLAASIAPYIGTTPATDPVLSPLRGNISRFPPTLLVTSTRAPESLSLCDSAISPSSGDRWTMRAPALVAPKKFTGWSGVLPRNSATELSRP